MSSPGKYKVIGNTATVWRPKIWEDVIGQDLATRALRGMLKSGKLKQAFLFEGAHGCGKTTSARLFAATVNCKDPNGANPCGKCSVCKSMFNDPPTHPDYLEMDGSSFGGVDSIRALQDFVKFKPRTNLRFIAIDECQGLSPQAQGALLKLYENPPEHVIIIILTTNAQGLIGTILSRAYKVKFATAKSDDNVTIMRKVVDSEGVKIPNDALSAIANSCGNHTRDCLNSLSYVIDQMRFDPKIVQSIKAEPEQAIAEMLDMPPYKLVVDFCTSMLCGKKVRMLQALKQSPNKVYMLKSAQELLSNILYTLISDKLAPSGYAKYDVDKIIKLAKADKSYVKALAKLTSELATVQLKVSQYTVNAEHASIGLLVKYVDLFNGGDNE